MDDADGKALSVVLSTAASPITFNHLSIRIDLVYTGVGDVTTVPKVLQVEVRAQLAEQPKRWRYLLDLADDHSAGSKNYSGATKIEKLEASIAKSVVQLKDGYKNRDPGISATHDVVIDTYRLILSKPGEGVGYIEMVEVL